MKQLNEEQEVKFFLADPIAFQKKLKRLGKLKHRRVHETNLRFDTIDGQLSSLQKVLRLRKDKRIRVTYKGPADANASVAKRTEIEFEVSDFNSARAFLEALGFSVTVSYEKFRTTYTMGDTEVVLDELPFGIFCEIEGRDEDAIRKASTVLELQWQHRCLKSYLQLFQELKNKLVLQMPDLCFADFKGLKITPENLGLVPGDQD